MSSQTSGNFPLPYPLSTDPVNVHGDIAILAQEVSETLDGLDLSIIQISVINDSDIFPEREDEVISVIEKLIRQASNM